ncbi:hypothetical protein [Kribbella deserti]|uniref:Uncharacterized protein n=1 Tax=Kribbella deserti TaxID=1926257 RepID=A0ABV6QRB8_9ACTN
MSGLKVAGLGMVVVLVDFRLAGFDLLADIVGWILVYAGLGRLGAGFFRAKLAAGIGGVVSLGQFARFEGSSAQLFSIIELIVVTAVVVLTCTALMWVAANADDERTVTSASQVRSANLLTTMVILVVGFLSGGRTIEVGGGGGLFIVLLAAVAFAASLWFIFLLCGAADRPYLQSRRRAEP